MCLSMERCTISNSLGADNINLFTFLMFLLAATMMPLTTNSSVQISRNDVSALIFVEILYERLVNIDQVDLLLGPFGNGSIAFKVAAKYNV